VAGSDATFTSTTGATCTTQVATPLSAGQAMVAYVLGANAANETFVFSDNDGNTWATDRTQNLVAGSTIGVGHAGKISISGGVGTNQPTVTVTATGNGTGVIECAVSAYNFDGNNIALDVSNGQDQLSPGTGVDGVSSGNVTTTVAAELAYAFTGCNTTCNAIAAGTGYTVRQTQNFSAAEDQVLSSTQTLAGTFTITTNSETVTLIVTYKEVVSNPTTAKAGYLHAITINSPPGSAATLSIFDLPAASCTGTPATNVVANIAVSTTQPPVTIVFDVNMLQGICVKSSVAMDITVSAL
jgi:hypothetical protein